MTQLPPPQNENESTGAPRRSWARRLRRIGLPIGVVLLAGAAGGTWWAWVFVTQRLAPLIETNLSQTLKRPVNLGRVERFSLTSIRFGRSVVPATPTDTDRASVEAVEVAFNPLRILLTRNLNLDITLVKPDLYLEQAADGTWISTQIAEREESGPVKTELEQIRFQDAQVVLVPTGKFGGKAAPVRLLPVSGTARFLDQNRRIAYELAGQSATGGSLNLNGETLRSPSETNVQIRGQNFLVSEIDRLVKLPVDLQAGRGSGTVTVRFRPEEKRPLLNGTARFNGVTMRIPRVPQAFTKATGGLQLNGTLIRLENVSTFYGKVPVQARGDIDTDKGFKLAATVKPTALPTVVETLKLTLPFAIAGEIAADLNVLGSINQPVLEGRARSTKAGRLDRIDLSRYGARFRLDTGAQTVTFADIQATPAAGGQVTGSGRVNLRDRPNLALNFQALNVPGEPIARVYSGGNALPITIGRVNAQAQISGPADNVQTRARWQAAEATYPASGEILVAGGVITLRDTVLRVANGIVRADAQAANGRWQAVVNGGGIQLSQFSQDLRGLFSGRFQLAGSLSSFRPADVRAQGQARFSQGISVIGQPLSAQVQWDGQKIVVQRATAPGFSANGTVLARLEGPGAPAIAGLDLNVNVRNYGLQALALPLPSTVQLSGSTDFSGRVTGTPTAPNVIGGLTLRQLALNGVAFEPVLRGNLRLAQGVVLDVAGQRDRIAITLDSAYRPVAFDIRRDTAVARGRRQGELLLVQAQRFPLELLNGLTPVALLFPFGGELSGNVALNLERQQATGDIAIANPQVGNFLADRFGGRIDFRNGVATLSGAELRRGQSVFQINGSASIQGRDPKFQGQILANGNLQDVLGLAQVFELEDLQRGLLQPPAYGSAADLQTAPAGQSRASVLTQLRRLSEIEALRAQADARRQESPLPELRELQGNFNSSVTIAGSVQTGVRANFDLRGQNWKWGPNFSADQVVAQGNFQDGVLTLLPLRFQTNDAVVAFSGQVGGAQQSGQLRVANVPIDQLTELLNLPLNVEGKLNATATLAGSLTNPQAIGDISVSDGMLNGTELEQAQGSFRYANARLDFGSTILIDGPEPISVAGSVPRQLPFATVAPDSDQISLDINVKNEGLALLNLLNNQVAWVDGQGRVNVQVRGTLTQPIATGIAEVQNATLQAKALPEPLTGVTGAIRFDRDRLRVDSVQGQFSQGNLSASGVIPIFASLSSTDPDQATPLSVALNRIRLTLKGIYQGGVEGNVQVAGTALNPVLGGVIRLSDGQVLLSESAGSAVTSPTTTGTTPTGAGQPAGSNSNVSFNNLLLQLGDRVRVTRQPIINFLASGDLTINGELNSLRPEGTVQLRAGQVNLFTTQFNLARGYPQTATFQANQGLDPVLDVRLIASVPEVTGSRLPSTALSSEILDVPASATSLGGLQTVRVQARVQGLASQLVDNLELTSNPARSQSEIVALIGGGFVATLGRGDTTLGIANLAGSALLTNIQSVIGNALGFSEFRLFPTLTRPDRARDTRSSSGSSTLGLAAEAAIDLTPTIALSALRILTSNEPTQFGLRYRLNDEVLLRGSTDFSGDSRATIEYETRF